MTEVQEIKPGKIPAEGSVWRVYFLPGETPSEDRVRVALGALGAVKTTAIGDPVAITHDASVDPDRINIETQFGAPISVEARAEAVKVAESEAKFDLAVSEEVARIAESHANQKVSEYRENLEKSLTERANPGTVEAVPDVQLVTITENESEQK